MIAVASPPLERAASRVREGVAGAAARLAALGVPAPELRGRLLRPLVAYASAPALADDETSGERFWMAVLAVQMAHEASLLHDDVIDGALLRRGEPALAARAGTAAAVVAGDHLLTGAYRAAALAGDLSFVTLFARAVERTVAGERRQAETPADVARGGAWRDVLLGKSGELFGCALATGSALRGAGDTERIFELGRRVGLVYQMLDDLLDYCPAADTGKAALADYRAQRWTWPLGEAAALPFGQSDEDVRRLLFGGADAPARRALARLEDEIDGLARDLARAMGPGAPLQALLEEWRALARRSVRAEESRVAERSSTPRAGGAIPVPASVPAAGEWTGYLGRHGRSFSFATSLMPAAERARVAAVYAWCRYTDDLVDHAAAADADRRLDDWLDLSRRAYDGERTGIALLDDVMGRTREADVPFTWASELIAGMRMDLRHRPYADLAELRLYTWRVAGTVGLWLAELHGVRDRWSLERAATLGQAMQLTNIVRDVGEDLARGRLYLPLDRLRAHGLSVERLERARLHGEPLGDAWPSLLEELMLVAERDYRCAAEALPALPATFRRAVAIASAVYAGIHDAVRRIGYDTLRRRAWTSTATKVALGAGALVRLGAGRRREEPAEWSPPSAEGSALHMLRGEPA
ncbi:MAG TPA: squalene/phytoene synthase family protein [Gemmatimonadaceae bacterium]